MNRRFCPTSIFSDLGIWLHSRPSFSDQARVSDWSVEPLQFGNFLCTIFDEWVRNDVGKTFVQLLDVSLEMWCGMEASLCVFRPTCGFGAGHRAQR